jgi:hypothetical protein
MGKRLLLMFVGHLQSISLSMWMTLSNAVNRKNSKFLVRCNESGVIFRPFVFGSLGNFEEDAVAIMKRIGYMFGLAQSRKRGWL